MKTITNNPDLVFQDISDEQYREYEFKDKTIRITLPLQLNVSKSGGHRVLDFGGVSHYIPTGWLHLSWLVKEGRSEFAF